MIGNAAIVSRQASNAAERDCARFHLSFRRNCNAIVFQLARHNLRHPIGQGLIALKSKRAPTILFQSYRNIAARHGQSAHHIKAGRIFAARGTKKFTASRQFGENLLHPDARTRRQGCWRILNQSAMIHHLAPALLRFARAALQGKARDAGNARQSLSAKAQSRHLLNRFIGQFRSRMTLQRQGHLLRVHSAAIIGHFKSGCPAICQLHSDPLSACINRILHQLFKSGRRALNNLACGDTVD